MLLDVNALVALAWPTHVHHEPARRWLRARAPSDWATTAITEIGFVRVSSNPATVDGAVSPSEAVEVLEALRGYGHHRFLADDVAAGSWRKVDRDRLLGFRQTTDAHLIELAARHDTRLVTFDAKLVALVHGPADEAIELLGRPGT